MARQPSVLQPLLRTPEKVHLLHNTRNGRTIASTLLTAFDSSSRRTGLLRHDDLPDGTVLIIAPSNAVHTIGMRFSIDVAFVARDGRIVKLKPSVKPWRMAAAVGAFAVLEFRAGALAAAETVAGDRLAIVPDGHSLRN